MAVSYHAADRSELGREQTVGSLLRWAAEQAPDIRALVEGTGEDDARAWTYAELLADAERGARALLGRFAPGERVAVWANNIPEWIVLEMAAALAGITLVTVNPALRPGEVRHVLEQSRAAGVFLLPEYRGNPMAESLASLRADLPELRETVLFTDWQAFLRSGSGTQPLPVVAPGDPAQIQFTSGTTGRPKGAVLHHNGIVNNAQLSYRRLLDVQPGDVCVSGMPLFHTAGCVLVTLSMIGGLGTQVLLPRFDPGLQLRLIEAERSFLFGGVPTMLHAMLDHPSLAATDLSSVRVGLSGGATVSPQLVDRVEATIGAPLLNIYAQTEASPGITMTTTDDSAENRRNTVGRPLPGIEVKIVDPKEGRTPTPAGVVGELCTRGYHVMTGYFDEPDQTAKAIDADGWLHTGDLAAMDDKGYLRIEGRLTEMIIRGGENIYPGEIEHVLQGHPDVADVAIVGVPDPAWGEQVAAFVILAPSATADEQELADFVRRNLAPYKTPRTWRFVGEFPLTGSGKVQKFALRDQLVSERSLT
ncbi:AMP-binding protein [Actinoplanes sp. RD1]|uniref:AMP-binding protein n=1 Tax=Actinoplanes sp. RD1 TaxID=3064538 RepID=UPI00274153AE|nr:AMP-binding protein [Actinoplanes sp. RD1]